jgi:hypothetical protein
MTANPFIAKGSIFMVWLMGLPSSSYTMGGFSFTSCGVFAIVTAPSDDLQGRRAGMVGKLPPTRPRLHKGEFS